MKAAAQYYSAIAWKPWVKVVESDTAPQTRQSAAGLFIPLGEDTEPLGRRFIEVPEFPDRTERLRDPKAGFVAYVPPGTLERRARRSSRPAAARPCNAATCHGANLLGRGRCAADRRPHRELHRPAAVQLPAGLATECGHAAGRVEAESGRDDRDRRVSRLAVTLRLGGSALWRVRCACHGHAESARGTRHGQVVCHGAGIASAPSHAKHNHNPRHQRARA